VEPFGAPSIHDLATRAVAFARVHSLLWYQIPAAAASLLLLLASFFGQSRKNPAVAARLSRGDWLYLLSVAFFVIAQRWPVLALGDLEGDESVAVSAALTRYLEPAYGITLFTGSAGPLLTYPVAGVGLLGFQVDYGASKLVSLLLTIAISGILYLALRTFSEARTARIALLPLLALLGMGNRPWTISYCSEQWINLLMISMIWFLLRLDQKIGRERANLCGIGLAFGAMPLIKWQGMPMAALVVSCAVAIMARRCARERAGFGALVSRLSPVVALGLAPLLVWCVVQWSFGTLAYFFDTYFAALFTQATIRYRTTWMHRLITLPSWGFPAYSVERWFLYFTALFCVPAAIRLCLARRARRIRLEIALALLYLAISLYAVLQPGGGFPHYMNLLLLPYAVFLMLVFCRWSQVAARAALVGAAYLGLGVAIPTLIFLQDVPLPVRYPPTELRVRSVDALRELGVSGSPMIQWGWVYAYYVHAGMAWGTRTGGSHEILEPFFPEKAIYIADYVASLESRRAPVFLDTAMEGSPNYPDRKIWGHELFPEVAKAVRRNYFPCAEFEGSRLFLLRHRFAGNPEIGAWCAGQQRRSDTARPAGSQPGAEPPIPPSPLFPVGR
jgi:hypothetical protein